MTYYYTANTFNPSSGRTFYESIVGTCRSAGYSLVETLSASSYEWTVMKSPSSLNGKIDFHFAVGYTPTSASYAMCLFEQWNTNSKTADKIAPASIPPLASDWSADTSMSYLPGSSSLILDVFMAPHSGSPLYVWAKEKTVAITFVGSRNAAINSMGQICALGVFDSYLPASSDPAPLYIVRISSQNVAGGFLNLFRNAVGRFTRTAGINAASGFSMGMFPLNIYSNGNSADVYFNNRLFSRMAVVLLLQSTSATLQKSGIKGIRGEAPDFYIGYNAGSPHTQASWTFNGSQYYGRNLNFPNGNDVTIGSAMSEKHLIILE